MCFVFVFSGASIKVHNSKVLLDIKFCHSFFLIFSYKVILIFWNFGDLSCEAGRKETVDFLEQSQSQEFLQTLGHQTLRTPEPQVHFLSQENFKNESQQSVCYGLQSPGYEDVFTCTRNTR